MSEDQQTYQKVSASSDQIEEWDEEHDEPHPVFRVDHRPERETISDEE